MILKLDDLPQIWLISFIGMFLERRSCSGK